MSRLTRHRHKRETPDIDVTTFLNLMVVLIPFLLVTAVFSRITIFELDLPTAAGGPAITPPKITIEVMVRKTRLEIGNGQKVVVTIPKKGDAYDIEKLSESLQKIKDTHPDKRDATVLVEPDIEYEDVIHVMDAVRLAEIREPDSEELKRIPLFPEISIGEAP
jgi:biopolymer transport protein ExbD